ncbi:MAG: PIN domain-containing protein [Candidatus Aenigmarchaeota archaeon]|nr:PIN domain-containing protein [Candidatus Aenigmarchaeota archaeon]
MTDNAYFFDTYALIEIFKGNVNYEEYSKSDIATSYFNLLELYYNLIKTYDKKIAMKFIETLKDFCVPINIDMIFDASTFKLNYPKKFSYADSIGYIIAKRLGLKFLTGDMQFKELDNVEFVK